MAYYLANTDFEFDLEREEAVDLLTATEASPILAQLQFLPLLFAAPEDVVLVTAHPPESYREQLLESGCFANASALPGILSLQGDELPTSGHIEIWGASRTVAFWAAQHGLSYRIPDIAVVRKIHSKAYTFAHTPKLPHAELVHDKEELEAWRGSFAGQGVLKTCYGVAAKGHWLLGEEVDNDGLRFCQKQWQLGLPVLAEPWVKRLFDFSTQWILRPDKTIHYLGATHLLNDERGQYQGTEVGPETALLKEHPEALKSHLSVAHEFLERVAEEGYHGPLGLDAFLYKAENGTSQLHPIVELNARQTMSSAALLFRERHCRDQTIRLSYTTGSHKGFPLLPKELHLSTGKKQRFRRQLYLESIA